MSRVFALLLFITFIGGTTPVAARFAVETLPPMTIAWCRFGTAGVLLWLTLRIRGRLLSIERRHWPLIAGLGLLCGPINQIGFLGGVKLANASHAGLFYALGPVLVFWLSVALRRERYNGLMLIAAVLAFAGAACIILSSKKAATDSGGNMLLGDLLLALAILSWSLFIVLSKPLIRTVGALPTLTIVFIVGTVLHTPLVLIDVGRLDFAVVKWQSLAGFGYITLITSFVNYLLIYLVIAKYEATRAMIVMNGHFLVTVAVEKLLWDEPLPSLIVLGAGLIVGAIALDVVRGWRRAVVKQAAAAR